MRKKFLLSLIVLVLFVAVGCSTSVPVSYMRPSNVNMGQYRNIAIASTVPYKGYVNCPLRVRSLDIFSSNIYITTSYTRNLPKTVANYATNKLVSTLGATGFYNIMMPEETDKFLDMRSIGYDPSAELIKAGYDAVMIPKIENMDVDEYIWSVRVNIKVDQNGVKIPEYEFYIRRIANITYSISIVDCKTDRVVAKKFYEDSMIWEDDFDPEFPYFSTDAYYLFKSMINDFQSDVLRDFVPARVVEKLPLMSNKPKLESVKSAYKMCEDGNVTGAYSAFIKAWNEERHLPSGYNAALLKGALGSYDEALALLDEINSVYGGDPDVMELYADLKHKKDSTSRAESQINGNVTDGSALQPSTSIYDYIIGN